MIALLFTALAIVPRSAEAQGGSADERAAKELFKQGLELQARNETAKACEKFNESYRLFPSGVGPMMNAAWCDENAGRTATAWRLYRRAAEAAKAAGRAKDAASADQKANALQPRLPYVTLRVPGTPSESLELRIDDEVVPRTDWNAAFPVDPGTHAIGATAPGRKPWSTSVKVTAGGKVTVSVPTLRDEASSEAENTAETARADAGPSDESSWSGQRTAALVVGGIGIAGLAFGGAFALSAKSTYDKSEPYCEGNVCSSEGGQYRDDASSKARLATVGVGLGTAAAVGAIVLWLTAPQGQGAKKGAAMFTPMVGPSSCGLVAQGRF